MIIKALFARRWLPITLLVLAATALCVRMGAWQLDRLELRRSSNARIAYITSLPAVTLPTAEDLGGQEYRAVQVQGVYDFNNQVALRNQVRGGEYGYHLLTPLVVLVPGTSAAASAYLVDRGWIPAAGNQHPNDWRKYDVPGTVVVAGVVTMGRAAADSGGGNDVSAAADQAANRFALVVDLAQISSQMGYPMPSFYIQAEAGDHPGTLPAAVIPDPDLTNGPHLGYSIQWFGFAMAMLVGFAIYVRRHEAIGI